MLSPSSRGGNRGPCESSDLSKELTFQPRQSPPSGVWWWWWGVFPALSLVSELYERDGDHRHHTGFACGPARGRAWALLSLFCFLPGHLAPAQLRPLSHPGSWQLCSCSPAQTWTHLLAPSSLGQGGWATAGAKPVLPETSPRRNAVSVRGASNKTTQQFTHVTLCAS